MDWIKRPTLSFRPDRAKENTSLGFGQSPIASPPTPKNHGLTSSVTSIPSSIASMRSVIKPQNGRLSVNEQTKEQVKMTRHAFTQVREAQRLRQLTYAQIIEKGDLQTLNWIDSTIKDAEEATWDMLAWVEPARVEQETRGERGMRLGKRMLFAMRNTSQRGDEKRSHLLLCLGSLSSVISHLHQISTLESQVVITQHDEDDHHVSPPPRLDEPNLALLGRHFTNISSTISLTLPSEIWSEEMPSKNGNAPEETASTIDHEISDMLAWRRSKQPDIVKRPPQTEFIAELESIAPSVAPSDRY